MKNGVTVGIFGGSGYSGRELSRWLARHPRASVEFTTGSTTPHIPHEEGLTRRAYFYFLCLPHVTTASDLSIGHAGLVPGQIIDFNQIMFQGFTYLGQIGASGMDSFTWKGNNSFNKQPPPQPPPRAHAPKARHLMSNHARPSLPQKNSPKFHLPALSPHARHPPAPGCPATRPDTCRRWDRDRRDPSGCAM